MGGYGMGGGGGGYMPFSGGGATGLPLMLPPGATMPSSTPSAPPVQPGQSMQALFGGGGTARPQAFGGPQIMRTAGAPATGMAGGAGGDPIAAFLMTPQGQQIMRMMMQGRPPAGGMM